MRTVATVAIYKKIIFNFGTSFVVFLFRQSHVHTYISNMCFPPHQVVKYPHCTLWQNSRQLMMPFFQLLFEVEFYYCSAYSSYQNPNIQHSCWDNNHMITYKRVHANKASKNYSLLHCCQCYIGKYILLGMYFCNFLAYWTQTVTEFIKPTTQAHNDKHSFHYQWIALSMS